MNGMEEGRLVHVVDDDEAMRDSLQWLLEGSGHRVRTYVDAASFLAAVGPQDGGCVLLADFTRSSEINTWLSTPSRLTLGWSNGGDAGAGA